MTYGTNYLTSVRTLRKTWMNTRHGDITQCSHECFYFLGYFFVCVNIPRLLQKWIEAVKVAIKSTTQKSLGCNVRNSRWTEYLFAFHFATWVKQHFFYLAWDQQQQQQQHLMNVSQWLYLILFFILNVFCIWVFCLHVHLCAPLACLQKPREFIRSPQNGSYK